MAIYEFSVSIRRLREALRPVGIQLTAEDPDDETPLYFYLNPSEMRFTVSLERPSRVPPTRLRRTVTLPTKEGGYL